VILFLGSSRDKVYPRLLAELHSSGYSFASVDEDNATQYTLGCEDGSWCIRGGECNGTRQVHSIFVRHAVARTLDSYVVRHMSTLQAKLNKMLLETLCPVVNPPSKAFSNYSKPYQLALLAQAGFDVPKTLVTNIRDEALSFYEECGGKVIFKGVSNVMSFAQLWKEEHFVRADLLPNSPTQFQEFVSGVDYRVHVVGTGTFVTRLVATNEDYRRSALADQQEILAQPAELPKDVIERSISFTHSLGLMVSGIDFKETPNGRLVALELNPFPQFTFYEGRSGQAITRSVVQCLGAIQAAKSNVFA